MPAIAGVRPTRPRHGPSGPAGRGQPARAAITSEEFDDLMARVGPFEPRPELAVAVSGGADSMALAILAERWVRDRRGRLRALIVDHGLRVESAAEAHTVARWLEARAIDATILVWPGDKPRTGIQARARAARYGLMVEWCRDHGVLHLLLAHHQGDQAETVLIRRARGSGADGLGAMASIVELADLHLLRPLLGVPKARLAATLEAAGQPHVDDPSNRDPLHTRVRVRALLPALEELGLGADVLAGSAGDAGGERVRREQATARLLARAVMAYPGGYLAVDVAALAAASPALARRVVVRCLLAVGGGHHPPRRERLDRLHEAIAAGAAARRFAARTIGGCRVQLWPGGARAGARLLICREAGAMAPDVPIRPGETVTWDGRFRLRLSAAAPAGIYRVGALGMAGWRRLVADRSGLRRHAIPAAVRPTLPSLWDKGLDAVLAVPHFEGSEQRSAASAALLVAQFAPAHALGPAEFSVACSAVSGV